MVKISDALKAKSDQLNALDLIGGAIVISIVSVKYNHGGEQPVEIFYKESNLPWKPAKSVLRTISSYWTDETDDWINKNVEIYFEPTVLWAGKADGGVRISGLSDIPAAEDIRVKEGRNRSIIYKIKKLPNTCLQSAPAPTEQQKLEAATKAQAKLLLAINDIADIAGVTAFLEAHNATIDKIANYGNLKQELLDILDMKKNQLTTIEGSE